LFDINTENNQNNQSSILYYSSYFYNSEYSKSEWSFLQFKEIEDFQKYYHICSFSVNSESLNVIRVFTMNGNYYELVVDFENKQIVNNKNNNSNFLELVKEKLSLD
jgi:hypothetical protein